MVSFLTSMFNLGPIQRYIIGQMTVYSASGITVTLHLHLLLSSLTPALKFMALGYLYTIWCYFIGQMVPFVKSLA